MSLLRRYNVKYESEFEKENIIKKMSQIQKIYNLVNQKFYDDETQHIVLTGSCALLFYITKLGFTDLLIKLPEPSDVDLLIVLNARRIKKKPHFTIFYIEDYMRVNKNNYTPIEPSNATLESSVTFKNLWTSDKMNKFDLTYVFNTGIHYNRVNNFNLIKLEELLIFYEADKDIIERAEKDNIKIEIIKEIISRLKANPRPDVISNSPVFKEIELRNLTKLSSPIHKILFDDCSSN